MSRKNWSDEKLLQKALRNKTELAYWENIHALRLRPSESLFLTCIEMVNSQNQKEKIIAVDILAQLGSPNRPFLDKKLKLYFELLDQEKDALVIRSILFGIGHNNQNLTDDQIHQLCRLDLNDDVIKQGLISALGFVHDKRAIDILIKLSADHLSTHRDWATFYIGESQFDNQKLREALWERVKDRHYNTKLEAIMGLAKRKDPKIIDIIKTELVKGRSTAGLFDAIMDLEDVQFLPLLLKEREQAKNYQSADNYWKSCLDKCIDYLLELKK